MRGARGRASLLRVAKSSVDGELVVPPEDGDTPLDRFLRDAHPGTSWSTVRRWIRSGKVSVNGTRRLDPTQRLRAGARIQLLMNAPKPRADDALADDVIVHCDAHLVVARKPAGMSSVPFDEDDKGALSELLRLRLARRGAVRAPLGIVHRLDKETSGLIVYARSIAVRDHLKHQLRFHTVHRRYLAIAAGRVAACTLRSRLVDDRGDGRRGSTDDETRGREAITHVSPLRELSGATLVECRLETGRTHQIRIHLAEADHPILGERVYARGPRAGLEVPRLMLHAAELGFIHPLTEQRLDFSEPMPPAMQRVLDRLTATG